MRLAAILALLIMAMLASTAGHTTAARSEILQPIAAGMPPR